MENTIWGQKKRSGENPKEVNPCADEGMKPPSTLENVDNRIFFYSEIERDKILQLNKRVRELNNQHLVETQNRGLSEVPPIYLHINSFGGGIFSGLSAMDNILQCKCDVFTVVDGVCASAATFISVVGKKRYITPHSFMLIHQLSSMFWGKYNEMKDEMQNLDLFMNIIRGVYGNYTKIPEKELNKILDRDIFFDAKTCIKYGLVDEII